MTEPQRQTPYEVKKKDSELVKKKKKKKRKIIIIQFSKLFFVNIIGT